MKHSMIKLSLDEIKPGMPLARSIVSESGELLLSAGNVVNERILAKMRELDLSGAWIAEEGTEAVIPEESVSEQLALQSQFVVKENADIIRKVAQIKRITQEGISAVLADTSRFKNIIAVEEIRRNIRQILENLLDKEPVAVNLSSIRTKSGYQYQHSLDVAVTAILLANKLKYSNREIEDLALGCLLMDLGTVVFPDTLTSKKVPMTASEADRVVEHPVLGYASLRQHERIVITAAHVAYQHHERQDGQEHPRGRRGENGMPLKPLSATK